MFKDFMDRIYGNIGGKLKSLAKWACIIGSALYIVLGLIYIILGLASATFGWVFVGVLMGVLGPLLIWIGTWLTYAFGELVEKAGDMTQGIHALSRLLHDWKKESLQQSAPKVEATPRVEEKPQVVPVVSAPKTEEKPQVVPMAPSQERPLVEKLEYALSFRTNSGMLGYLKRLDDPEVAQILQRPEAQIRAGIEALVQKLKSE